MNPLDLMYIRGFCPGLIEAACLLADDPRRHLYIRGFCPGLIEAAA